MNPYFEHVLEYQGKLFDYISTEYPNCDTVNFIEKYMNSNTRKAIDNLQAKYATMDYMELWDNFHNNEGYKLEEGKSLGGFVAWWIGEFYEYYREYNHLSSKEAIKAVPVSYLINNYGILHDLDLGIAVKKVSSGR